MAKRSDEHRIHNGWWTLILFTAVGVFLFMTTAIFNDAFASPIPVTLTSDRAGLVMETGAKVQFRGVQVGRVGGINSGNGQAHLTLEIDQDQVRYLPANIEARVKSTTAFGAKFVELVYPQNPLPKRLAAGSVLQSNNASTEVNTVFENVVNLLDMVDPLKLNAVLTALADGVRGQGQRMGEATTALNEVLTALNERSDTFREDWRKLGKLSDAYNTAADDILTTLDAASTTSATIVSHSKSLDGLLLNAIGFAKAGTDLMASSKDNFVMATNILEPTTNLLFEYSPSYTCTLLGAQWFLDNGGRRAYGGGTSGQGFEFDIGLLLGNESYTYPDNLPVVAAKGGPDGRPGCGSLPDPTKNWPVRKYITNTGWGTGLDLRPNAGIGFPGWIDYFPVTRAVPENPTIRYPGGPAPGPIPYPGAPPYGAPLYGPGGAPLWPGVPPADPAPASPEAAAPPQP